MTPIEKLNWAVAILALLPFSFFVGWQVGRLVVKNNTTS